MMLTYLFSSLCLFLILPFISSQYQETCAGVPPLSHPVAEPFLFGSGHLKIPANCGFCVFLVNAIEKYTERLGIDLDEFVMKDYCRYFDKGFQDICRVAMNTYGPRLISTLLKTPNPDEVCREIGLCH